MKLQDIKETAVILAASACVTAAISAMVISAWPKIEDYIFFADRDKDRITEQYIVRDGQLKEIDTKTNRFLDVEDSLLKDSIYQVFRPDSWSDLSWALQGAQSLQTRTPEELELILSITSERISDYLPELLGNE